MEISDEIARLQMERKAAIEQLHFWEAAVQKAKQKNENAKSSLEQCRFDSEHRRALASRYKVQDRITQLNSQIKLLHSSLRAQKATQRRERRT